MSITTDCYTCEEEIEVTRKDYACPNCEIPFDAFMYDRITRAFADEETFDNVVGYD
jgi:predicted amidophosphoribosyltransferase